MAEQLTALGERLGALEERTNVATPNLPVLSETKEFDTYKSGKVLDLRTGLSWEALQRASCKAFTPIRSHSDIVDAFVKVLQPLGLRKTTDRFLPRSAPQPSSADRPFSSKGPLLRASHAD